MRKHRVGDFIWYKQFGVWFITWYVSKNNVKDCEQYLVADADPIPEETIIPDVPLAPLVPLLHLIPQVPLIPTPEEDRDRILPQTANAQQKAALKLGRD